MKKIAIYCRVSTALQEQEKTVESQLSELRGLCKNFEIVGEYIDENWSGEVLARPELDRLRDDALKGLFDAVYIHSPDRLARKYAYQVLILEELKKRGVDVVFLDKPVSDKPEDKLLLGVQGIIAEYEKTKILERTRRGRMHKAKSGLVVGSNAPYGYFYVRRSHDKQGYYEIDQKEADIVRLIFNLYLKCQSVRGVAKELTKMNINPQKGFNWRQSTLHRILRNESYIGTTYYNKSEGIAGDDDGKYKRRVNSKRRYREKKDWIAIKVPTIVNENTFNFVQEILLKQHKNNNRKYFYLLGGSLIKCSCGSFFAGENCHGKSFYRCNNRHKKFPLPRECKAKMIKAEDMDVAIWETLKNAIEKPNILMGGISFLASDTIKSKKILKEESDALLKEKERIITKKNKLVEIYSDGVLQKDIFIEKIADIKNEEERLETRIKENQNSLTQVIDRPLFRKAMKHFCRLAKKRLKKLDFEKKREFIRYVVNSINFDSYKKEATIYGSIPLESGILSPTLTNCDRQQR